MPRMRFFMMTLLIVLAAPVLLADDVSRASKLLCTSVQATSCNDEGGECVTDVPWNFNIPQFIEIDLTAKMLSTTKASDESRQSPILTLTRNDGLLVIQGLENGRAFSFVINEQSGRLSAAVARDGITVTVFGACTPITQLK